MNIDLYGLGGDECGKYRVDCCYMSMNIIVSGFIDQVIGFRCFQYWFFCDVFEF